MSDALSDLFDRARLADIEKVAGTPLFRAGKRMRGECPLCGASKGKKAGGAFSIEPGLRVFKCFGCGEGGDVVRLEQLLGGGSPREAAERLAGPGVPSFSGGGVAPRRVVEARPAEAAAPKVSPGARLAAELWQGAQARPIGATPAAAYFTGRGIWPVVLERVGDRLRFNPAAKWGWDDERGDWIRAPAIVGRVVSADGPTGGVHVTYLNARANAKARLDPAKRMFGPQRDAQGRPGGVWLTAVDAPGPLIVAEGIESALSAATLMKAPCRVVAALSLGALQGGWLADKYGRIDPAMIVADPAAPAFTWPEPEGAPWGEVMVAVDRDMSPIKVKVRKLGGGTVQRALEAEDRARICAGLALQAWTRAGANGVRAIAPGAGRDFNDELRERML